MNLPIWLRCLATMLAGIWFYLALAAAFVGGWFLVDQADIVRTILPTPALVATSFFLNGLALSSTALVGNLRLWYIVLVANLLIFGAAPGLMLTFRFFAAGWDVPVNNKIPLLDGLLLLSVVPTTLVTSVILSRISKGNSAIALYITVSANLLAVPIVPMLMRIALGADGAELDVIGTALNLAALVVLPTVFGQLLRRRIRDWIVKRDALLGFLSRFIILLFILNAMTAVPREGITGRLWLIMLGLALVFHLVLLVLGDLTGWLLRTDQATRRALAICSSEKTLVLNVYLWERLLLPLGPAYAIAIIPGIAYYLVELIIDSIVAQWWGRNKAIDDQENLL